VLLGAVLALSLCGLVCPHRASAQDKTTEDRKKLVEDRLALVRRDIDQGKYRIGYENAKPLVDALRRSHAANSQYADVRSSYFEAYHLMTVCVYRHGKEMKDRRAAADAAYLMAELEREYPGYDLFTWFMRINPDVKAAYDAEMRKRK
jgi:hypothetical protein